jgi:hypothetical protein
MRDWWLRTLLVLQRPKPVFVALRDESKEAVSDRSEQVLLIVMLAGVASVLSTRTGGRLMDSSDYDNLLVAVWAFLAGSLYGVTVYFLFGGLLHLAGKALGSQGTYRRARHVLAFAAVPLALSLVVWPVKLALYGDALFRSGGSDSGAGGKVFQAIDLGFLAWTVALILIGVRAVHGWPWPRAAAATALGLVLPIVLGILYAAR